MTIHHLLICFLFIINSLTDTDGSKVEGLIGGVLARENELNYQVSIQENGNHLCGGCIIDDFFVISSAHCFFNIDNATFIESDFTIVAGSIDLSVRTDEIRISVRKVYILRNYGTNEFDSIYYQTVDADISIVELKDSLNISKNSRLRKLQLVEPTFSHTRKNYRIAGYGISEILDDDQGITDGLLRYAEAESVSNHMINKLVRINVHGANMCARVKRPDPNTPAGVCKGDGGSPLVYQNEFVAGILFASSVNCTEDNIPSIYSRIAHHHQFIQLVLDRKRTPDMRVAERKKGQLGYKLQEI